MARLVLAHRPRSELLELGWPLIDAIEDALGLLEREPRAGHALRGKLRGLYSLRVGAYRILYQLTDGEKIVRVVAIRHRAVALEKGPAGRCQAQARASAAARTLRWRCAG